MAKRIDLTKIPVKTGSDLPTPFDLQCAARARQRLGDAAGLTDFGSSSLAAWLYSAVVEASVPVAERGVIGVSSCRSTPSTSPMSGTTPSGPTSVSR